MDKFCEKIFLLMAFRQEKMGFNELARSLEDVGAKMSRPTLSEHLKHLTKKKVLKKKKIGKQRVSYEVNWQKNEQLLDARELGKKMQNRLDEIQKFRTIPFKDLMVLAEFTLKYIILQQFRLNILSILNPKKTFDYNLEALYISRHFHAYTDLLLQECRKNKEVGEQLLQILESEIKDYWNIIPDHI